MFFSLYFKTFWLKWQFFSVISTAFRCMTEKKNSSELVYCMVLAISLVFGYHHHPFVRHLAIYTPRYFTLSENCTCTPFRKTFDGAWDCLLHWDISVICPVVILKLAATVFTSLPFQTSWLNWINFVRSLKEKFSSSDRKNKPGMEQVVYSFGENKSTSCFVAI